MRVAWALTLLALVAALLPLRTLGNAAPEPTLIASDTFARVEANRWGTADLGGSWSVPGAGKSFAVDGSVGTISLPVAGASRVTWLSGVVERDADVSFAARTDKSATGRGQAVYAIARYVSATTEYRAKVRFGSSGQVLLQAIRTVNGVVTPIGSELVAAGVTRSAGQLVRVRAQFEGASPTTIRIRAWADGQPEPTSWTVSVTDSEPALQVAGAVGVRAYLASSTSNAPVLFGVDDFRALDLTPPEPDPTPTPTPALLTYASDTFTRATTDSWASADAGGAYSLEGTAANLDVAGGRGLMQLPAANANRGAVLRAVYEVDVDLRFRVATDRLAEGSGQYIYAVARRIGSNAYRPKIRILPDGRVMVHAGVVLNNVESSLGPAVQAPGLVAAPGAYLWVRSQISGTDPTTIRVRAWADGIPEPTEWHFSATNAAAAVQSPGAVGLRAYLGSDATAGVTLRFDDLNVTSIPGAEPIARETLVGAGDIATCTATRDEATANLLDGISGTVFTAGDNAYDSGTAAEFQNCYEPSWGRHKARTRPAVGNHEYRTPGASGYFGYFGAVAAALGGYYAYDLGEWRIYVLNSQCSEIGGCGAGSAEELWLRTDLAANPTECVAAFWHEPRYSSGTHGNSIHMSAVWNALHEAGAELVVSSHDHLYERFAPQNGSGVADLERGVRQFVVGTGGASLAPFSATPQANSEVRNNTAHGVLRLVLRAGGYDWQFLPVEGKTFMDTGTGTCH